MKLKLALVAVLAAACYPACASASAPYMGVDTWYGYGPDINESTVVNLTDATAQRGLLAAGYRYIWIETWWDGQRDANGDMIVDPARWPHGMAWLVHYIHAHGFLAGIYTDLGVAACHNGGSLGHYQQDVNQFAAWGFDAVKVDACGAYGLPGWEPERMFGAFERAIVNDTPHRVMLLNVGNGDVWDRGSRSAFFDYAWASKFPEPTSWRTAADLTWPGSISWAHLLRNIDEDAMHPEAAGHGHWNEPDYLAPMLLPPVEAQTQVSMWAILAAPMMVGAPVDTAPQSIIDMLTNAEMIAISQDPLGVQGSAIAHVGQVEVWKKPLAKGDFAVALLNRGNDTAKATITDRVLGLGTNRLVVHHIWGHWTQHGVQAIHAVIAGRGTWLMSMSVIPAGRRDRARRVRGQAARPTLLICAGPRRSVLGAWLLDPPSVLPVGACRSHGVESDSDVSGIPR